MNWGLRVLLTLSSVYWVIAVPSPTLAQSSCNSFAVFAVGGGYNVQNNGFNLQGATQCVTVNSSGTNWSVTTNANVPTNGAPSGYPSIYAGCHWGTCSPNQRGMPIPYISITSSPTTWNVTPQSNGNWDIAYDIWFNPNSSTNNNSTGLELMVWINHMGSIQPAGSVVASNVAIGGRTWNIWRSGSTQNRGTISYVATNSTSSFNFDLLNIYRDLVNRGYMSPNQWLIDIEAGTEIWTAGSNFATNSFSACVNCGAPATPTNLTATAASSSQINLSWTGSSGATSYNVLRSNANGGPYTQVASGATSTSFSDTGLAAGTTYFYVVQACNSNGCSGNSNQASATTQAGSSANCHGGTQCLKGTLPGSQNYSNTSQAPNASSNQTYVASIWIKGAGSVQLYVKNGNWGSTTLATVKCTASSSYTKCSTPSFSVGGNTQLTFILQDSYAGSGTVYLDDAFLGISGGSNVLSNPGFESGSTGWSISNTSTWSIGRF